MYIIHPSPRLEARNEGLANVIGVPRSWAARQTWSLFSSCRMHVTFPYMDESSELPLNVAAVKDADREML